MEYHAESTRIRCAEIIEVAQVQKIRYAIVIAHTAGRLHILRAVPLMHVPND